MVTLLPVAAALPYVLAAAPPPTPPPTLPPLFTVIGAAYEHEFDGRARATSYGYSLDAPSLKGGTGIGELGLTLKPSKTLPLSFDLGVQGYAGKREGVTGSLQARWEF